MAFLHYSFMSELETQQKTDSESINPPYQTAFAAEKAFYHAFVRRDIKMMKTVWSPRLPQSHCLHPGNSPLNGYEAIIKSWEEIFSTRALAKLQIEHKSIAGNDNLAVHRITEHLSYKNDDGITQQATFHVINVLQRIKTEWFMLSHHAAPAPIIEKPSGATVH